MVFNSKTWAQLSALLDTVLELPEDQRLSWVDNLATDSPEIKAQLRVLLATTRADDLLRKPPDFAAALLEEVQRFDQIEIELQPDKLIGPYRLLRELGKGGMGTVWLAQRVDGKFKREVALKFPYAGPRQRELTERLLRERDILASLEHPNIARLYDADVTASGQPFLVLEYIDGIAINHYCDQQRLDIRERLMLFQQVLSAVRYAHNHLVIHRDIKPSNILITADGMAHLLDFGVAKSIVDDDHESPLTQFGGHVLTPEYASPEQIARVFVTTASDVYTSGVVLYELLTGASPYKWNREHRAQLEEAIASADIILPSRATINPQVAGLRNTQPKQLVKALRGELDTLLLKALKKNVDGRYASVGAFHEDVARYLGHQPILAQPDSQWYRVKKFTQRNRVAVASLAAIMAALLAGTGIALWQAHVANQQRNRAIASAARSEAIAEFMRTMITEVADANKPITMKVLLTRTEESTTEEFTGSVDQRVAILEVLGGYYEILQLTHLANQSYIKAFELAESSGNTDLKARLSCKIGNTFVWMGSDDKAQQYLDAGLRLSQGFPETKAQCLLARSLLLYIKADVYNALKDLSVAKQQLHSALLIDPELPWEIQESIARYEMEIGQVTDAKRFLKLDLQHVTGKGKAERSTEKIILEDLSEAERYAGNPKGALQYIERAEEVVRKFNSSETKGLYANNYAALYSDLGRYAESLNMYRDGIEFSKENHDVTAIYSMFGIAKVELALGHIVRAEQEAHKLEVMMNGEVHATDGIDAQNFLELKTMLAIAKHRYPDAVNFAKENIDFLLNHKMLSTPLVTNLNLRGEAYLGDGNMVAALADATQAYGIARSVQDSIGYSKFSGETALLLSKIHNAKNENDEAHKWVAIAYQQLQGSVGVNHPDTLAAKHLLDSLQTAH